MQWMPDWFVCDSIDWLMVCCGMWTPLLWVGFVFGLRGGFILLEFLCGDLDKI